MGGCVSSNFLTHDDDFSQLANSALSQHIVSLTSTTYGLLSLDPPSPPHPKTRRLTLASIFSSEQPEVINSWELMAGLDADSFRFTPSKPNTHSKPLTKSPSISISCPPRGENRVVVYTTSLRGVRKTFEDCSAVVSQIEGLGFWVCQRDVSMDRGFKEELRGLMKGRPKEWIIPPRVFVKGRYLGGAEEVLRVAEEGVLGDLLKDLPKIRGGSCEGCGGSRFLPCFRCCGSCKVAMKGKKGHESVVVRCTDCNENGLVICPICC